MGNKIFFIFVYLIFILLSNSNNILAQVTAEIIKVSNHTDSTIIFANNKTKNLDPFCSITLEPNREQEIDWKVDFDLGIEYVQDNYLLDQMRDSCQFSYRIEQEELCSLIHILDLQYDDRSNQICFSILIFKPNLDNYISYYCKCKKVNSKYYFELKFVKDIENNLIICNFKDIAQAHSKTEIEILTRSVVLFDKENYIIPETVLK